MGGPETGDFSLAREIKLAGNCFERASNLLRTMAHLISVADKEFSVRNERGELFKCELSDTSFSFIQSLLRNYKQPTYLLHGAESFLRS